MWKLKVYIKIRDLSFIVNDVKLIIWYSYFIWLYRFIGYYIFWKKKYEKDCLFIEISWVEIVLGVGEIIYIVVSGFYIENG